MTKKELLIVEDNINIIESLSDIFIDNGIAVSSCFNGKEALNLISSSPSRFDLILTDIMMPKMNGISFLEKLSKNNTKLAHIPVVFLTAKKDTSTMKRAFKLGAYDYIEKPFTAKSITNKVMNIVNDSDYSSPNAKYHAEYFSLVQKIKNLREINSHSIQHSIAKITSAVNLVESGLLNKQQSWEIFKEVGIELNKHSSLLQEIIEDSNMSKRFPVLPSTKQIKEICLIDDDPSINKMHEILLTEHFNYKVITYLKPKIALKDLTTCSIKPDLLFLDINMPNLDGFQILEEIESSNIDIDIIMLSSSSNSNDIAKSLTSRNVISFITKPLTPDKLMTLNLNNMQTTN